MPGQLQFPNLGAGLAYIGEPVATVGSSLLSEVPAGWYGLLTGGSGENVEHLHHDWTSKPITQAGRKGLADIGRLLSGAGGVVMDTPYLGAAVRNFGESRDALTDAGYPGLAAALTTAPAAVALAFPGGEGARAIDTVGRGMAKNAMSPRSVGPIARQAGFVNPMAASVPLARAFKLSRAAKASATGLAGERAAQRVGSGLERTHKGYVAERTAGEDNGKHGEGRNLLERH